MKVVEWLAGQSGDDRIGYSYYHCLKAPGNEYNTVEAARRVDPLWKAMQQDAMICPAPNVVLGNTKMMCSELVTQSFQGKPDPYIDLNAKKGLPPHLESWLIKNMMKEQAKAAKQAAAQINEEDKEDEEEDFLVEEDKEVFVEENNRQQPPVVKKMKKNSRKLADADEYPVTKAKEENLVKRRRRRAEGGGGREEQQQQG